MSLPSFPKFHTGRVPFELSILSQVSNGTRLLSFPSFPKLQTGRVPFELSIQWAKQALPVARRALKRAGFMWDVPSGPNGEPTTTRVLLNRNPLLAGPKRIQKNTKRLEFPILAHELWS